MQILKNRLALLAVILPLLVVFGMLHLQVNDIHFPNVVPFLSACVATAIQLTGPACLIGASLLALPQRGTFRAGTAVVVILAIFTAPAHLYAAVAGVTFDGSASSLELNWFYTLLMPPIAVVLILLVRAERETKRN